MQRPESSTKGHRHAAHPNLGYPGVVNRRNAMIGWLVVTLLRRRMRGGGRGVFGAVTSFVAGAIVAAGLAWLLRGRAGSTDESA